MAVNCGVPNDDGISSFLKCSISQNIGGNTVTVRGYMSEECQMSLRSLWQSPFTGDSVGDIAKIRTASNIGQSFSETTSKTRFNSQEVWEGQEPPEVTLQLRFIAYTNAYQEVDLPIRYLMQMASPELKEYAPISYGDDGLEFGGAVPSAAQFDLGGKFSTPMRISEVSFDINAPKTPSGHFAHNTVSITASPKTMINRSQIPNHFKL